MPTSTVNAGVHERPSVAQAWEAALRAVHAILREMEQEMAVDGLPLTWYDVLIQLYAAHGHRLQMKDLAEQVVLSRSGLTRLVDRMEEKGLVRRVPLPGDRRGFNVVLEEAGRARYLTEAPKHLQSIETRFGRHLDQREVEVIYQAMRKILEARRGST